jgi:hypothetical protein
MDDLYIYQAISKLEEFNRKTTNLEKKMKKLGWISGALHQKDYDEFYWTEEGKSVLPVFISEMRKHREVFTDEDIEFAKENLFVFGIKEKSKKERLFEDLSEQFDLWGNEKLITIAGEAKAEFSRMEIFDLLEWIYANNAVEISVFRSDRPFSPDDWVMKLSPGVYK